MDAQAELKKIIESNPDLIFNNNGYEEIKPEIQEANKDAIQKVEDILRRCIRGFVRFQNFKPRPDGSMSVRYQVHYNDEGSFTGVAYNSLEEIGVFD